MKSILKLVTPFTLTLMYQFHQFSKTHPKLFLILQVPASPFSVMAWWDLLTQDVSSFHFTINLQTGRPNRTGADVLQLTDAAKVVLWFPMGVIYQGFVSETIRLQI